ncbi:MAG: TIGR04438 family Trp-rich protein [Burkholderiaceae bacterium]|nr:TIGR04438 family Trp-rich protein [Burkholderiaceae bacterium]
MWFVVIGCLLVLLKIAGVTFVADWNWLLVLAPFALAAIWWVVADATGYTKRREAEREDERVRARRERHLDNMGLNLKRGRPTGKPRVPSDD